MVFFFTANLHAQDWEKLAKKDRPTFQEIQRGVYSFFAGIRETSGRKPGFKQFKRWEWFAESRLDKDGYFDPSLNWNGWLEKEARFGPADKAGGSWTPVGPSAMPGLAGLGRLNCIEFDPQNTDIIWVGSPTGGLWKSIDGGQSWTTNTDGLPNLGVSDIVIHPGNPNIMYIATGDKQRGSTLSVGVMKSWDGGQTWNFTGLNPQVTEKYKIGKLVMHPQHQETLIAATNKGIYKTSDGGATWVNKLPGDFFDIEVHSLNSSIWYASRSASGIYRSMDAGESWTRLTNGLPNPGADFGRIAIAMCQSFPGVLYAVYCEDRAGEGWVWGLYGVYRSSDGGDTWTQQTRFPNLLGWSLTGNDTGGQGGYALILDVNPGNPNEVYIGSANMWKSQDAGVTWRVIATAVHVDHHDFAFLPGSSSTLFSCNDGGIYKSIDSGATWIDLSSGLGIHEVYRLGISPQDPNMLIIGAQDNGSSVLSGEWFAVYGLDGAGCLIDPSDNSIMYCSSQFGNLLRSTDGGKNFYNIFSGHGAAWIAPLIMAPHDPAVLYTADQQVFRSDDRGITWRSISGYLIPAEPLRVLAAAPSCSGCLYATDGNRLFKTTDTGATWTEPNTGGFPPFITDIAVHPQDPDSLWVSLGGYGNWNSRFWWFDYPYEIDKPKIFHSADGGINWTDVSGLLPNIPVNCIAIDPYSLGVYVGTDLGIFYSASGFGDWQRFDNGLPNVIVTDMAIHSTAKKIVAGTFGRGVWESPLATSTGYPRLYPPLHFSGHMEINKSLLRSEYIKVLSWVANPRNGRSVVSYRVYQVSGSTKTLLAELGADTFTYWHRSLAKGSYTYILAAVDGEGYESEPLYLSLRVE